MENFSIKFIDGETILPNSDLHFILLRGETVIGSCHSLEGFVQYSENATHIGLCRKIGDSNTVFRIIPICNVLYYSLTSEISDEG